jgi:hypothetical protein
MEVDHCCAGSAPRAHHLGKETRLKQLQRGGSGMAGRNILAAAEIKSTSTFSTSLLNGLYRFRTIVSDFARGYLIYNGDPQQPSDGIIVCHYTQSSNIFR